MKTDTSIVIKNIYYMLSYAFRKLKLGEKDFFSKEDFENIHDLFAEILAHGIGVQLKQGLYREYLSKSEDLALLRGKINIEGTIKNQLTRKALVTCEYDDLSENNIYNQILKTTAFLLIKSGKVKKVLKEKLKIQMMYFSKVDLVDPKTIKNTNIDFRRNAGYYPILINICKFILDGILITTDSGNYKLANFVDDQAMSKLYEKFILEYYKKEHEELEVSSAQIPWALDDGAAYMLPTMRSDVYLEKDGQVLIIDAKYYSSATQKYYDKTTIISANLYQIFTYVKNEAAKSKGDNVSGMLLYAATDEEIQPKATYKMSGNKISAQTLDLNTDFKEIKYQLDKIVEDYFP